MVLSAFSPPSLRRFVASSLILFLSGCGGTRAPSGPTEGRSAQINTWLASQPVNVPAMVYRIEPPDKLRILAPRVKEKQVEAILFHPESGVGGRPRGFHPSLAVLPSKP